MKKIVLRIRDYIVAYSKYIFPVLLIAVVAVTVSIALGAREKRESLAEAFETDVATEEQNGTETGESVMPETDALEGAYVPLEYNAYPEVWTLVYTYYKALESGDAEAVEAICNYVGEMEKIKIREQSKYIESYPVIDIYTKPGPLEGSYIVFAYTKTKLNGFDDEIAGIQPMYVCTDVNGNLYLNEGELTQEELTYISEVSEQDDVKELTNKTYVEYTDTLVANEKLYEYIAQMEKDVRANMGVVIAEQENNNETAGAEEPTGGEQTGTDVPTGGEEPTGGEQTGTEEPQEPDTPVTQETIYVKATTTVNVRESASTKADRIGSLAKGLQVKLIEEQANGWSKVEYEGKEGYIKSQYLEKVTVVSEVTPPKEEQKAIGKVTATTNVRIRELPSTDSERLGIFVEGEQLELLAVENGWCKVLYNGKVAYVSEKYVTKKLN